MSSITSAVGAIGSYFYPKPVIKDDEKNTPPIKKDDEKSPIYIKDTQGNYVSVPKVRYQIGGDRYSVCDMEDKFPEYFVTLARTVSSSVGCLMPTAYLTPGNEPGSFKLLNNVMTLEEYVLYKHKTKLIRTHRFGKELLPGSSTVSRIGPNALLTAGHCMTEKDPKQDKNKVTKKLEKQRYVLSNDIVKNYKVVFNFTKKKPTSPGSDGIPKEFPARDVYTIKYVQNFNYSYDRDSNDFAVVFTTEDMGDHIPILKLSIEKPVSGTLLGMVGHPDGGPQKVARDVVKRDLDEYTFDIPIAANQGNSGSAMFDDKGYVRGILTQGYKDYVKAEQNGEAVMIDHIIPEGGSDTYSRCRYITPEMFNSAKRLYDEAIKQRKTASDENSKLIELHLAKEDEAAIRGKVVGFVSLAATSALLATGVGIIPLVLTGNTAISSLIISASHDLFNHRKRIQEIQKIFSKIFPLNMLEAHLLIPHFDNNPTLKFANDATLTNHAIMARNMSGLGATYEEAHELHCFDFSPMNLLSLIRYEKENRVEYSAEKRLDILRYMTAYNPITQELYTLTEALEEMTSKGTLEERKQ